MAQFGGATMASQTIINRPSAHYWSRQNVIEGMAAQGKGNAQIAKFLGTSLSYVENIVRVWRHSIRRPDPEFDDGHIERDKIHVALCLAGGGFPSAITRNGRTYWMYPHEIPALMAAE